MEMEALQASLNVALSRSILNMQASLASQLINGSTADAAAPATQTDPARAAGLAAEGIGTRLDAVA